MRAQFTGSLHVAVRAFIIRSRPALIGGFLAQTGLTLDPSRRNDETRPSTW
jgi:hypothetical protein